MPQYLLLKFYAAMYRGNRETFALKRQLIAEAKRALPTLPLENDDGLVIDTYDFVSRSAPKNVVFVYEWTDDETNHDGRIVGIGCNRDGVACRLEPKIQPGLFVVSADIEVLREICNLEKYPIIVFDVTYAANNFAVYDLFRNYDMARPCHLVKILTQTTSEVNRLYFKFKKNQVSYKYVCISQYWDITKQIMFELLIKRMVQERQANPSCALNYTIPDSTMQWFDEDLNIYSDIPTPTLPLITFDIETVSSDPHRVPDGSDVDDVLFTTSIHHVHTNTLYTLIYLPLMNKSHDELKQYVKLDGYDMIPEKTDADKECENPLEVYSNEVDLLRRTMDLLTVDGKLHHLVGYNSFNYDIKYLLMRCLFYGETKYIERFVWREGYCYGLDQIHLDLFRIIIMRYRFKQYTLNEVSKMILKESKTGVSAVALRYTFFRMLKHQKYFKHEECNEKMPSVRDTLHYNNADTLLVSKLLAKTRSIEYIINRAMKCQVPLSSMNTNYNKMQYNLWNECFVVGLNSRMFLGVFKASTATITCSIPTPYSPNDYISVPLDLTSDLKNSEENPSSSVTTTATPVRTAKFPGGANFCLGEYDVSKVQMYDYVTAYPLLIDRKNISDETATILPANILLAQYHLIRNPQEFETFDYLTHSGNTKSATIIQYYQYIYNDLYCGGQFPFTVEELRRRQNSPVIIIWQGRRGILSEIVAKFNAVRAETKIFRKILDGALTLVEDTINELIVDRLEMEELMASDEQIDDPITITNGNDEDDLFGGDDVDVSIEKDDDDDDDGFGGEPCNSSMQEDENEDEFGYGDELLQSTIPNDNDDFEGASLSEDNDGDDDVNKNEAPNNNPTKTYNFECTNEYLTIYENKLCVINKELLNTLPDPIAKLNEIKMGIILERDRFKNSYDLQKSLVSSIYGCVGKMIPVVAAIITCTIRSTLIKTAQYLRSLGYNIYYIDTDSVMIVGANEEDLSPQLNKMFPHTEMECKVADRCMFVRKKTYYKVEDGNFKYGQNVNGPPAWRECVEYFYNQTHITTNDDIYKSFYTFFKDVYRRLLSFEKITPEFLDAVTQTIVVQREYKTMAVAAKFKVYLAQKYPALEGSFKHKIYYHFEDNVRVPCFRPAIDLTSIDNVQDINLFKYYQNMYATIFNLIKFHIKRNNEPYNVTISSKFVLLKMMKGFVDAWLEYFPTASGISKSVIESSAVNDAIINDPDSVFDDPIYLDTYSETGEVRKFEA